MAPPLGSAGTLKAPPNDSVRSFMRIRPRPQPCTGWSVVPRCWHLRGPIQTRNASQPAMGSNSESKVRTGEPN